LRINETYTHNEKSFKRDEEVTNLGYYNWVRKTPVWIWK